MSSRITFHLGGFRPDRPNANKASEVDPVADTVIAWDSAGTEISRRPLTPAERAAALEQDRAISAESNRGALRDKARQALDVNATFLALGAPTNAQTLTQVQRLTRETSALIRLLIGQLDDTTGT